MLGIVHKRFSNRPEYLIGVINRLPLSPNRLLSIVVHKMVHKKCSIRLRHLTNAHQLITIRDQSIDVDEIKHKRFGRQLDHSTDQDKLA